MMLVEFLARPTQHARAQRVAVNPAHVVSLWEIEPPEGQRQYYVQITMVNRWETIVPGRLAEIAAQLHAAQDDPVPPPPTP